MNGGPTMKSRERIFQSLASVRIGGDTSYPTYSHPLRGITDACGNFRSVLEAVGGECFFVKSCVEVKDRLAALDVFKSARNICSCVTEIEKGNIDIDSVEKVHDLNDVDLAIVRGEFGVGENAAVWINADALKHRGVLFLSENLVIVIDSGK